MTSAEVPDGINPDAAQTWPPRELIDSFLGGGTDEVFAWRPGEVVTIDGEEAQARARRFRDVLGRYASGVTIITTTQAGRPTGLTCQSFTSVSLDPPLVAFLPTKHSRAFGVIRHTRRFCVNFLSADQSDLSNRFASRVEDKFDGVEWEATANGQPRLAGTAGWVDCTVEAVHEAGDHYLVIGRVEELGEGDAESSLLFHRGRYGSVG